MGMRLRKKGVDVVGIEIPDIFSPSWRKDGEQGCYRVCHRHQQLEPAGVAHSAGQRRSLTFVGRSRGGSSSRRVCVIHLRCASRCVVLTDRGDISRRNDHSIAEGEITPRIARWPGPSAHLYSARSFESDKSTIKHFRPLLLDPLPCLLGLKFKGEKLNWKILSEQRETPCHLSTSCLPLLSYFGRLNHQRHDEHHQNSLMDISILFFSPLIPQKKKE